MTFSASLRPANEDDFGSPFMDADATPAVDALLQVTVEDCTAFLGTEDAHRLYLMLRSHFSPVEDIEDHLKELAR